MLITSVSGQAIAEFAMAVTILLIFIFAAIDFGRALNDLQVMADLTRQGSDLASRGTPLGGNTGAVAAVVSGESSLDLVNNGNVIITAVTNTNNVYKISGQDSSTTDGRTKLSTTSKIGTGVGTNVSATLPAAAQSLLQNGQTLFITEVFYGFTALTPIGTITNGAVNMPTTLYDSAYF
jgi:Flp pilus assembly protein TadG